MSQQERVLRNVLIVDEAGESHVTQFCGSGDTTHPLEHDQRESATSHATMYARQMPSNNSMIQSLLPLALLILSLAAPALAERTVVREEDGITVEEDGSPGRALPILTGTTIMAVEPKQIAAWIGATHTYTGWMHNCEEARMIRRDGNAVVGYNRIASPWPVSDRDVVLRSTRSDLEGGGIRVDFRSTTDEQVPTASGVVRMPRLVGSYELRPVEQGTRVVYTVDSDPGGRLPKWLVRQASKDLPYFTLKNLRERAESGPPPAP